MSENETRRGGFALNSDFPRILTLLRKEKGYSQKQVAADLGVSQALLSHYEKGIRECGLDFVVRAADYYNISCDYLLGRTPHRNGAVIAVDDLPNEKLSPADRDSNEAEYQRRILVNSINIVFSLLKKINNKGLTRHLSHYLSCAVYKAFRVLYSSNHQNPQGAFKLDSRLCGATIESCMAMSEAKSRYVLGGGTLDGCKGVKPDEIPMVTPETLTREYPTGALSLTELIRNTETAAETTSQSVSH